MDFSPLLGCDNNNNRAVVFSVHAFSIAKQKREGAQLSGKWVRESVPQTYSTLTDCSWPVCELLSVPGTSFGGIPHCTPSVLFSTLERPLASFSSLHTRTCSCIHWRSCILQCLQWCWSPVSAVHLHAFSLFSLVSAAFADWAQCH